MPTFVVILKANVENIIRVAPAPERDTWQFKVKCDGCNEVTAKFIEVSGSEQVEVDGGVCNTCFKCKECKKDISINILSDKDIKAAIGNYSAPANPKTNPRMSSVAVDRKGLAITAVDFRGGEPVDMLFDDGFVAYGVKKGDDEDEDNELTFPDGAEFTDVDLSQEYADYDEATDAAVTISDVKAEFVKDKNLAVYFSN